MPKRESYLQPPAAADTGVQNPDTGFDRLMSRVVSKYPHLNIGDRAVGETQSVVASNRPRGSSRSPK
jgi:hypothetical protein